MARRWRAVLTLNLRDHLRAFRLLNADGSAACALDGRDSEARQLLPQNKRELPCGLLWGAPWLPGGRLAEPVHRYAAARNPEVPFLGIAATSGDP